MTQVTVCQQFDQVIQNLPARERLAFNRFWQAFVDGHLATLMDKYDCSDVFELATHHPDVYRAWIAQFKTLLYEHGVNEHYATQLTYDQAGNLKIKKRRRTLTIPVTAQPV